MGNVYMLFWFDVEDCTVPQSDDAAGRLASILTRHGVRGTFKVVGQKARVLEQRVRYKVIDALQEHDIGFHANWHGLRPQIAEYLAPLDWEEGVAEFERREEPGLLDVRRLFGVNPVTYGQPGSNWAPHVFPALRKWGIPTYVSGFGYIGVDCQPFWLGGVLCTSHMSGKRLAGQPQRHHMGMNFELGSPGELTKHKETFSRSLEQLSTSGGVVSIINHPCTLVLEEWWSTYVKPRELTEAGYRHFEEFVEWALGMKGVRTTCASELVALYPDLAVGRCFSQDDLATIAGELGGGISFIRLGTLSVSAAEAFGLLVNSLNACLTTGKLPEGVSCTAVYNPTERATPLMDKRTVPWDEFATATRDVAAAIARNNSVPNHIPVAGASVSPAEYLGAVARTVQRLIGGNGPESDITIQPEECRFEDYVDDSAAAQSCKSGMMLEGFTAPRLLEFAKLLAWTVKPAILRDGS